MNILRSSNGLRSAAGAMVVALAVLSAGGASAAGQPNAHREALGALDDVNLAIGELNRASSLTDTGAAPYKTVAQRAINVLVGKAGAGYEASAGSPGDAAGAIGHLSWLRDHAGSSAWQAAIQGALVNAMVARAHLDDAMATKGLDEFRSDASDALESLLVTLGRATDSGVFGGLQGALATTALGVPDGAKVVSGCTLPSAAPAYGVVKGHLTFVAVPRNDKPTRLPESIGVENVTLSGDFAVLHTGAWGLVGKLCGASVSPAAFKSGQADPPAADLAKPRTVARADPPAADPPKPNVVARADPPAAGPPKLYTEAQAEAGKQVYDQHCMACHGARLQGNANKGAPAIAGTALLKRTQLLGWSVADLHNTIAATMPRNDPGSLSPKLYAQVTAYLLATDCYPAGQNRLPIQAAKAEKNADLQALKGVKPDNPGLGTCTLHSQARK